MADLFSGASAQITPFSFNTSAVRVIVKDGAPWFVASDVCKALGYKNTTQAVADNLDSDERSICQIERGGSLVLISESGLYALVLRSRKPEARKFAKWVTSEVLPAIRKTGSYAPKPLPNVDQALAGANLIAARVQEAVFKQLLEHGEWAHERWLLSFNFSQGGAQPAVMRIERDAYVMSIANLTRNISDPGFLITNAELANLASASNVRLAQRMRATPGEVAPANAQQVADLVAPLRAQSTTMKGFAQEVGLHESSAKKLLGALHAKGLM